MSHETRPSVTKTHPELDHGYDEDETHEQQSTNRRRRNFLIGAGATFATIVLAGGLALGLKGGDAEKTEPRQEPGTSAPANPNASNPPAGEKTAEPTEVAPGAWTAENVPLVADIDGDGTNETYTGQEALSKAFELKVSDYATSDEAAAAFVGRVNTLLNWGNDPTTDKKYIDAGVTSRDGEWGGTAAVREDYVIPAFNQAVFGAPDNVEILNDQKEGWMQTQIDLARQTGSRWAQSDDHAHPYVLSYEVDKSEGRTGIERYAGDKANDFHQYWIDVKTKDNTAAAELPPELGAAPVEGETTWSVAMQQQGDTWKIVGIGFK
jgi:hypothetical protein